MITVFFRTLAIFAILIASMRLMGKRQIGELQISELVVTLMLSELAVLPICDAAVPVSHALVPILLLIAAEVILSFLETKSNLLKKILGGKPAVLIRRGSLDFRELARHRIEIEELTAELRLAGVFDVADVEYAVLEESGRISVKPKAGKAPAAADDAGIAVRERGIARAVVVDGELVKGAAEAAGTDERAVTAELNEKSISVADVFLMAVDDGGEYSIYIRGSDGAPVRGALKGGASR